MVGALQVKSLLFVASLVMAVFMYLPLFERIVRRKHTRDFSKPYQWLVFLVQVNNGILALAEHAPFLFWWYVVQSVFTGITLWLTLHYWNCPPPVNSPPPAQPKNRIPDPK